MVTLTMSDVYNTSVNGIPYDSSLHTDIKREVNNHSIVYRQCIEYRSLAGYGSLNTLLLLQITDHLQQVEDYVML